MDTAICALCGKEVKLIRFGDGWVGECCDKIAYNKKELPKDNGYAQTEQPTVSIPIEISSDTQAHQKSSGKRLHVELGKPATSILSLFLDYNLQIVKKRGTLEIIFLQT